MDGGRVDQSVGTMLRRKLVGGGQAPQS